MNVTDVDDKIILRARRNYLLKRYEQSTTDAEKVNINLTVMNVEVELSVFYVRG